MPHVASLSIAISGVFQGLGAPFRRRMAALRLRQSEYTDFTSERTQGWRNGVRVSFVSVDDVDAVYKEFVDKGLVPEGPPIDRDYGVRDFSFRDPDGHHIGFGTRLN